MGLDFTSEDGQTPLEEDEKEGLLISSISTRGELDEFEQQNIEEALQWVFNRSFKAENVFTARFVCELHKKMFGHVWAWAGAFRKTNKNLGVDKWQISIELQKLCNDALYWIAHHTYTADEIAIRFKHRLVSIHCFSNGNGRHSRLIADVIVHKVLGMELFGWGMSGMRDGRDLRKTYLDAIRAADAANFGPLLAFARS